MPSYNKKFRPSAPIVRTKIIKPEGRGVKEVNALIDSGASLSVIPETIVTKLGLIPQTTVKVKGWDGSESEEDAYYVNVIFETNQFDLIKVLATKRNFALIGRDILNQLILLLNGQKEYFEILHGDHIAALK